MKILKKLLVRIILLILTVGIVCGSVVAVLGYFMYRDALKEQSLEDRVAEVQANPSYTTLAELPDIYLEAVVAVEDHRFRQHCGIDIIAIARAAWNNIKQQDGSYLLRIVDDGKPLRGAKPVSPNLDDVFLHTFFRPSEGQI